jgi:arabinofuranosyltransferase
MTDPSDHRALIGFMVVALAGFAALLTLFFPFTAEDAWIVARYARNAVEHGELVFNRGEYVNALTSPLDAFLGMLLHALTPAPILAHKLCAIAFSGLTLAAGYSMLRTNAAAQATFLALTAFSAPFALWTVGGLETPLLALLATLFVACLWRTGHERFYLAAFVAGLAFLARHDSVLFTAPAMIWALRGQPLPRWIGVALVAEILPVAWLVFALVYFHDPLPTSFHLKGPGNIGLTVGYNALYLIDFLLQSGVALVLAAAFALAQGRLIMPTAASTLGVRAGLWLGIALAVGAYGLIAATVHMMFSFRLFMPYLPAMALLVAELLGNIAKGAPEPGARRIAGAVLVILVGLQATLAYAIERWTLNPTRVGEYQYSGAGEYRRNLIDTLPQAAAAIDADWRAQSTPRRPRVLTLAAGLLPWHLPDAYIFEDLVSWRRACPPDRRKHAHMADYVHLVTPWSGTVEEQLPGPPDRWQQVWQRTTDFDGSVQTWMVYRNRTPDPTRLPGYVDGPCRLPDP